jgi:hypothetical protein
VCSLTRLPERFAEQTLGNCVVTVAWNNGSLTVQGVVLFNDVAFTKNYKILTFRLK